MRLVPVVAAAALCAAVWSAPVSAQKSKDTFRMALDQEIAGVTPYLNPSPEG